MLENLHLEAIRIIIGGIRGTSHQKLYKESGFCTLKERRKRHKLLMFHKMILGLCPQYISDLLPPLVAHINPYHRRRPLERDVTTCKTELYRNSFIPSTTAELNSLPISVQQSTNDHCPCPTVKFKPITTLEKEMHKSFIVAFA